MGKVCEETATRDVTEVTCKKCVRTDMSIEKQSSTERERHMPAQEELHDDFDIEQIGGEPLTDSTAHGWGFEISAMQHEAMLRGKWQECLERIEDAVMNLIDEKTGEDIRAEIEHCPDAIYFVKAITDSILTLKPIYLPLIREMNALQKEAKKMREMCHSAEG